jgi:selenocysteine lyase/cysteine desulfurase
VYLVKYYFSDYACSAPYVIIDGSIYDAFFFSPHKFIGGISTPGLLVAKSCLFNKSKPYCTGGGCVKKGSSTIIEYDKNIEKKESAGTPNIIGIIKIKKILELKEKFQSLITHNEELIYKLIKLKIEEYKNRFPNFKSILYNDNEKHLPILSFSIDGLHYNFIVGLFNDKFGIQTRGGIGCCGLLAEHIENQYNIKGWCRISFHWLMDSNTITYIFEALEYIISNGHKFLKYYNYNEEQNLYQIKKIKN